VASIIKINSDRLFVKLLCWYAFFIPLERILAVFLDIDTVLKPYRVFALLIIGAFVLRTFFKWRPNREITQDIFLYIIFIYGILVSCFKMMSTVFNLALFLNDVFQTGIYIAVFIIIRHLNLNRMEIEKILKYLCAGVLINGVFVYYSFSFLGNRARIGGFMDNPNYLGLSVAVVALLLMVRFADVKGNLKKGLTIALILFMIYLLGLSGSRTSFAMFAGCILLMIYFSTLRMKLGLIVGLSSLAIFLQFGGLQQVDSEKNLTLLNRLGDKKEDNRIPIWTGTFKASQSAHFAGMGIGQFKAHFREFFVGEDNTLINNIVENGYFLSPHSDYLAYLVVYGAIGLFSYLVFVFLSTLKVYAKYRRAEEPDLKRHYLFCLLVLVGLAVFGIANENLISPIFWLLLCLATNVNIKEEEIVEYNKP
jgi:O-antigen ligase